MKREWVREQIAQALAREQAGLDAYRAFRASIDWLPHEQITRFVAKHVAGEAPVDLVSWLRRMSAAEEVPVLAGLRERQTPALLFFESLVSAGIGLPEGVEALAALNPPNVFGTPAERRALASLAAKPAIVEAARAALHLDGDVSGFLALCIAEGSAESADAVLPWVERARRGEAPHVLDDLEHLTSLAPKGSAVSQVLRVSTAAHRARTERSAVTAFLAAHGWKISFLHVTVASRESVGGLSAMDATFWLDAESADWATFYVTTPTARTKVRNLSLEEDALGLGPVDSFEAFPAWLARAAKRLQLEWDWASVRHQSKLRGKARAAVTDWLRGRSAGIP